MIHISDWLPTFGHIAGYKADSDIDGKNIWKALSTNMPSPRREVLLHHDQATPYMAYVNKSFKLVSGSTIGGKYDGWVSEPIDPTQQNVTFGDFYSDSILFSDVGIALAKYSKSHEKGSDAGTISRDEINNIRSKSRVTCKGLTPPPDNSTDFCNPFESPCLFNILIDPCETTNLASTNPRMVNRLKAKLDYYGRIAKKIRNKPSDPRANPANYGGIWTWWYEEIRNE